MAIKEEIKMKETPTVKIEFNGDTSALYDNHSYIHNSNISFDYHEKLIKSIIDNANMSIDNHGVLSLAELKKHLGLEIDVNDYILGWIGDEYIAYDIESDPEKDGLIISIYDLEDFRMLVDYTTPGR
jgi:hypothetical protein